MPTSIAHISKYAFMTCSLFCWSALQIINMFAETSNGKMIRGLNGSKSSNWILVGTNGKRHLRQPTPRPTETFPPLTSQAKTLPPIKTKSRDRDDSILLPIADSLKEDDVITKVNKWGLKTNRVTLSALLEV